MDKNVLANTIAIGVIIGIGAFFLSYAYAVWRSRNRPKGARPAHRGGRAGAWRVASGVCLAVALAVLGLEALHRVTTDHSGVIRPQALFTIRSAEDNRLQFLREEGPVGKGEELARFVSPEREARLETLHYRGASLEARQKALANRPLDLDRERIRRHQLALADLRQLRNTLDQLVPARDQVRREGLRQQLDREQLIRNLDVDLDRARTQRFQAVARLNYLDKLAAQTRRLSQRKMASETEALERATEKNVIKAEVENLDLRIKAIVEDRKQVAAAMERFAALVERQAAGLDEDIRKARNEREGCRKRLANLEAAMASDRERAQVQRRLELKQLALQVKEVEAERQGLRRVLSVKAPFAGHVAWREPSPETAFNKAPLLVMGGEDCFKVECRMDGSVAAHLAKGERIPLRFPDNITHRLGHGVFDGTLDMPGEGEQVLVRLHCVPPAETIRTLAAAGEAGVELRWHPPLLATAKARLSALLLLLAGLARLGAWWVSRKAQAAVQAGTEDVPGSEGPAAAVPEMAAMQGDNSLKMLDLLVTRFLDAVIGGRVEDSLLAAVEWSLGRHHQRAFALLLAQVERSEAFAEGAGDLLATLRLAAQAGDRGAERTHRRLAAILDPLLGSVRATPSLPPFLSRDKDRSARSG